MSLKNLVAAAVLSAVSLAAASDASAGCKITLKAKYIAQVKNPETNESFARLRLDLVQSQVRVKGGWWKRLEKMCVPNQPIIALNGNVALTCDLDLACGPNRQYRFQIWTIDANGQPKDQSFINYPSQTAWVDHSTNTVIDLGDLGTAFGN